MCIILERIATSLGFFLEGDSCLPNQCSCPNGTGFNQTGLGSINQPTGRRLELDGLLCRHFKDLNLSSVTFL